MLDATINQKYRPFFLLAVMTGAREGEIIGLKWDDVDFDAKQLHIFRTFNHGRFFAPKTRCSARTIDLSPSVIRELAKWKLASVPIDSGLVLLHNQGNQLTRREWLIDTLNRH